MSIDARKFIGKAKYRIQYADYDADQWTIWYLLTETRLDKTCDDLSVSKIEIAPFDTDIVYCLDVI